MRLLNVETCHLEQFFEPKIPSYAILSHRWEEEEVTLPDIQGRHYKKMKGFKKIRFACDQASLEGLSYVWIDTCCIDKTSSAELSEAINSMFRWYQDAVVCYAYLSDVLGGGLPTSSHDAFFASRVFLSDVLGDGLPTSRYDEHFTKSAWFKRGWTLQELIAPKGVIFYDNNWSYIGSRDTLWTRISLITGIHREALWQHRGSLGPSLGSFSIAQKMSWAALRETTRIEDRAYSLIGIFGVNMPLLYGEGDRAFIRLQEEILKSGSDLSILAWRHCSKDRLNRRELLATCPEDFAGCNSIVRSPQMDQSSAEEVTFTMTNVGLRVEGPFVVKSSLGPPGRGLALSLECRSDEDITKVIALKLEPFELPRQPQADSQQPHATVCYAGWDNDEGRGDNRLISIGLLEPARSPLWPALTISRELVSHHLSHLEAAFWHTHFWVQLPEDRSHPWSVLKLYPKEYWNPKNLTFDLQDTTFDRDLGGAIALSDNQGSQIAIFFAQKFDIVDGFRASGKILFEVSRYDQLTFPSPERYLNDKNAVEFSSVQTSTGREVVVRYKDVKRSGILIAHLAVSATPVKRIENICGPPYELGAP